MPHHEIERFLESFANSLGGSPKRIADLTDELRDHLESHAHQAAEDGRTPSDAISQAMSEFGDAPQFAAHLKRSARRRRIKRALRGCAAPILGVAAAAMMAVTVLPAPETDRGTLGYAPQELEEIDREAAPAALAPRITETAACRTCHFGEPIDSLSALSGSRVDFLGERVRATRPRTAGLFDDFASMPVGCQKTPHADAGFGPVVEGEGC